MPEALVTTRREDAIAILTLNRPEKRNALDREVLRVLGDLLADIERDRDVRAVVLHGAGKVFSAGVDFATLREDAGDAPPAPFRVLVGEMQALVSRFETVEKPIVVAMHGIAPGLALELALACDVRIVTRDCRVGLPEVKIGLVPDVGGTARLVRTVGHARAKELILTGRLVAADEALRLGLVHEVVAPDAHVDAALRVAREIAGNAPLAVGLAKRIVDLGAHLDTSTFLQVEQLAQSVLLATADAREGTAALAERRAPRFTGL